MQRAVLQSLCILAALLASGAASAKRVVMLGIGGAGGADASHQVTRGLAGRFELVSRGRVAQEAAKRGSDLGSPAGRALAARALKVAAMIGGSVSRVGGQWVIRIVVHNGSSGHPVGTMAFPMRGMRLDAFTARRVVTWVIAAVGRARVGPPVAGDPVAARPPRQKPIKVAVRALPTPPPRAPARTPPPPAPAPAPPPAPAKVDDGFDDGSDTSSDGDDPKGYRAKGRENGNTKRPPAATDADLEFDDTSGSEGDGEGDEGDGGKRRRRTARRSDDGDAKTTDATAKFRKGKPSSNERPEWEKIIEISVGVMMLSRSFDFHDPVEPKTPSNYSSGLVPALIFGGETYPLAYFGRGPLANLGIVGHYYRVPVLRSQVKGSAEPVETTLHEFEGGLRYRWNFMGSLGSPTLKAGLSFGRLGFVIHWDPLSSVPVPLPNIIYVYLKFATALDVPFFATKRWSFGATASFDYLYIFSAGDIERTDTSGYGRSNTQGIEIGGGLYASYRGFFLRATGFYRRIFYAFDNQCYNEQIGCNAAGGALDIYQGATILGGYAF